MPLITRAYLLPVDSFPFPELGEATIRTQTPNVKGWSRFKIRGIKCQLLDYWDTLALWSKMLDAMGGRLFGTIFLKCSEAFLHSVKQMNVFAGGPNKFILALCLLNPLCVSGSRLPPVLCTQRHEQFEPLEPLVRCFQLCCWCSSRCSQCSSPFYWQAPPRLCQ